jgi:hypothetical protein
MESGASPPGASPPFRLAFLYVIMSFIGYIETVTARAREGGGEAEMERDMELIRTILLKVEADPRFTGRSTAWMQPR